MMTDKEILQVMRFEYKTRLQTLLYMLTEERNYIVDQDSEGWEQMPGHYKYVFYTHAAMCAALEFISEILDNKD